ncbi:MAG: hypothetical protein LLG20_05145 [Acidobacteriales bacterium]|nr:hypothetical protein [Terriglobales bacterium]
MRVARTMPGNDRAQYAASCGQILALVFGAVCLAGSTPGAMGVAYDGGSTGWTKGVNPHEPCAIFGEQLREVPIPGSHGAVSAPGVKPMGIENSKEVRQ